MRQQGNHGCRNVEPHDFGTSHSSKISQTPSTFLKLYSQNFDSSRLLQPAHSKTKKIFLIMVFRNSQFPKRISSLCYLKRKLHSNKCCSVKTILNRQKEIFATLEHFNLSKRFPGKAATGESLKEEISTRHMTTGCFQLVLDFVTLHIKERKISASILRSISQAGRGNGKPILKTIRNTNKQTRRLYYLFSARQIDYLDFPFCS